MKIRQKTALKLLSIEHLFWRKFYQSSAGSWSEGGGCGQRTDATEPDGLLVKPAVSTEVSQVLIQTTSRMGGGGH